MPGVHPIAAELAWLEAVLQHRLAAHAAQGSGDHPPAEPPPPALPTEAQGYAALLQELRLNPAERLVLALALAPHVMPDVLDPLLLHNQALGRRFTEFGGWVGQTHGGLLPTVQTALFLLAGQDVPRRLALMRLFSREHPLFLRGVLQLDHRHPDEPPSSAALRLGPEGLERLLTGAGHDPAPSHDFPAQRISTPLDWADLVLDPPVREQIEVLSRWIVHSQTLLHDWGLAKRLKPGYRCLFHGPPGTGKTLTACLLGKRHGMPVYRVDLSQVVSKWIGETEKNLAALFDRAVHHQWILFFDEADALFGKRTEVRSSNDRSANQQVAYLLQRIEDFPGIVILASNLQAAMDDAFMRRFQSSVLFAMPGPASRLALWRDTFQGRGFTLEPGFTFDAIAAKHEVAGGTIVNVLRHAALAAVERSPPVILGRDILLGLRQELQKDA